MAIWGGPRDTVRTPPGSDTAFAAIAGWGQGAIVYRVDFPNGVRNAPTIAWAQSPLTVPGSTPPEGFAVSSNRVAVSYFWNDTGSDAHVMTVFEHDGSVSWRLKGSVFDSSPSQGFGGLTIAGGLVVLSMLGSYDLFPASGEGVRVHDELDGSLVTQGDYPLEGATGPLAAVCTSESGPGGGDTDE